MSNSAKTQPNKSGKKSGTGLRRLIFVVLFFASPFILPTLLVLLGMVPTLVMMVTDDDPEGSRTLTVGALNFAGVTPFLINLWEKGQTIDIAIRILSDPNTWLAMLGAAALGRLILFAIPPLAVAFSINQAENRLAKLQESQKQLKAIWGPEVATNDSLEAVRQKNIGG